LTPTVAIWVQL